MPLQPGEASLLTLYSDVHYYFSAPAAKPLHHRFDKGSYVYLYHNAIQRRGRVEVANNAGTPEQDAFSGDLESARITYSYKHPTLVTFTLDAAVSSSGRQSASPHQEASQWQLPASDQYNQGRYMYRLHTVDLYFWTESDAGLFVDSLKRVVSDQQLDIKDAPAGQSSSVTEHRDTMSPVVQKLEEVAISKPYQDRSNSISTTHSFAPPPTAAVSSPPTDSAKSFQPVAYNPAAPAAPEPVKYREKTPPPPDDGTGTGLTAAVMYENAPQQQYGAPPSQIQQPYGQSNFTPGVLQRAATTQSFLPPPPMSQTPPALQRANTSSFPPPPPPPPGANGQGFGQQPSSSTPPQQLQRQSTFGPTSTQYASYPQQPQTQYATYPQSPGHAPLHSPGLPGTPGQASFQQPLQSPGIPVGGYSNYTYQQGSQQQMPSDPYAVHAQAYRPTEHEAAHGGKPLQEAQAGPGQQPGRFEARAEKLEKGVGRFLRKLDKKF